jgi:hypothetical protein
VLPRAQHVLDSPQPTAAHEHHIEMGAYSPVRLRLKSAIGNHYCPDFALCSRRGCTENVPRLTRDYLTQFGLVDADT